MGSAAAGVSALGSLGALLCLVAVDLLRFLRRALGEVDAATPFVCEHGLGLCAGGGRPAAGEAPASGREREDRDGVLAGVRDHQPAALIVHRERHGRGADPGGPLDGKRPLHREVLRVDDGDQVLVGDRDVGQVAARVDGDPLGVGEVRTDAHVAHLLRRREIDDRHGPVGLVGHEAVLAVARDGGTVGIAPDGHVAHRLGVRVDDGGVIGEVQRDEQRLAVRADGHVARPRQLLGRLGREALHHRGGARRRHLDEAGRARFAGAPIDVEDVHDVALLARGVLRGCVGLVRRLGRAGDVGGPAVGRQRDTAARPGQRDALHDPAGALAQLGPALLALGLRRAPAAAAVRVDGDDAHVVEAASCGDRPQVTAVRGQGGARGQVAQLRRLADRLELAPTDLQARLGRDAALLLGELGHGHRGGAGDQHHAPSAIQSLRGMVIDRPLASCSICPSPRSRRAGARGTPDPAGRCAAAASSRCHAGPGAKRPPLAHLDVEAAVPRPPPHDVATSLARALGLHLHPRPARRAAPRPTRLRRSNAWRRNRPLLSRGAASPNSPITVGATSTFSDWLGVGSGCRRRVDPPCACQRPLAHVVTAADTAKKLSRVCGAPWLPGIGLSCGSGSAKAAPAAETDEQVAACARRRSSSPGGPRRSYARDRRRPGWARGTGPR